MKRNKILGYLMPLVLVFILFSCSDDEDFYEKREREEHTVMLKVFSNTEHVPFTVWGESGAIVVKDYWESTFKTKKYYIELMAKCEDKDVLLRGEIYIDGKLKRKKEANRDLDFTVKIKGGEIY